MAELFGVNKLLNAIESKENISTTISNLIDSNNITEIKVMGILDTLNITTVNYSNFCIAVTLCKVSTIDVLIRLFDIDSKIFVKEMIMHIKNMAHRELPNKTNLMEYVKNRIIKLNKERLSRLNREIIKLSCKV